MNQLIDIKGIGKTTLSKLENASINSIEDLLLYYPKSYKIQKINNINHIKIGETVSLEMTILNKPNIFFFRKNLSKLSVDCYLDNHKIKVDIFNRHFLSKVLFKDVEIVVTGRFKNNFKIFTANDIVLKKNFKEGIIPLYNIDDIKDGRLRKIIEVVLKSGYHLEEILPDEILKKRNIQEINNVVYNIHQPKNMIELEEALNRLKYQELLMFALRITLIKKHRDHINISKKTYKIDVVRSFIKEIGFNLTNSQKQATNDIFKDLKSDRQMNRLLQGDVGSGKTIVSILTALASVTSGYQVAVMAPTLVLSYQHFDEFKKYFSNLDVNIVLLTSETSIKEKRTVKNMIANNEADIIIGTHSLIQEDIQFSNLGLVIIDEQHRFGVNQRKILRQKGYYPDILLMSATPIPRSLAISIFESSDVSQITEKPKGRKPIFTNIYEFQNMKRVYQLVNQELNNNNQVYVICPLIEENETTNYFSVMETYDILNKRFPTANIGMLHGKMKDKEKIDMINQFKNNEINILISTTVIEVGIHIDKATTMLIMNANAFGLAQLHQLRGRIGRSDLQSYCCLIVDESVEDIDRLKILENTDDGFEISAQDLKLRGPGEIFGKNQAGIPNLSFANIVEDQELLEQALTDASQLVNINNPEINQLKNQVLKTLESYHLD
ncbi:MAG: ATP-dependent DNA helicase RecG [Tenericutes bacterium]|nr:ATP-dependent DNA helicase RecG [Mycoplasmatota bacterium]